MVNVYISIILSGAKQIQIIVLDLHSSKVSSELANVLKREVNKNELNQSEDSRKETVLHLF